MVISNTQLLFTTSSPGFKQELQDGQKLNIKAEMHVKYLAMIFRLQTIE